MGCAVGQNCLTPYRCLERWVLDMVLSCVYSWKYNFVASDTVNTEKFSLATFKSVAVTNYISNFTRSKSKRPRQRLENSMKLSFLFQYEKVGRYPINECDR